MNPPAPIAQPNQLGMLKIPSGGTSNQESLAPVIDKVEKVFGSTNGMLMEMAKVESDYGRNPNTDKGAAKGPWQVNKVGLKGTQNTKAHPDLKEKHARIKAEFGIDWKDVTVEDMKDPLHNAIAARLYLSNDPDPIPDTMQGRAELWERFYNTKADAAGTAQYYMDKFKE